MTNSSGEWPFRAATNDVKLRVLEEENEKLQSLLADCTGKVQVLQGEIARLKHHREMKSNGKYFLSGIALQYPCRTTATYANSSDQSSTPVIPDDRFALQLLRPIY